MNFKSLATVTAFFSILALSVFGQSSSPAPQGLPRPTRLRISRGVSQGVLIHKVQPEYPASAKAKHIEGDVIVRLVVDKAGKVIEVSRLKGDEELAGAAMDAVRQWKFRPYLLNGEPIEIETTATLNFHL
jgi:protein TonB